jgi:hypothetical protein
MIGPHPGWTVGYVIGAVTVWGVVLLAAIRPAGQRGKVCGARMLGGLRCRREPHACGLHRWWPE